MGTTAVTSTRSRRLAGVAIDVLVPPRTDVLPRMDIAVFAGFAASGPVNRPVAIEDAAQFAGIFGADAPLAWDAERGRLLSAQLGPAVRSFFANEGQRCWVIRLARDAVVNTVTVPGTVAIDPEGTIEPLSLVARSPGSWADDLAVSSSITSTRARFVASVDDRSIDVALPNTAAIGVGDLLRLTNARGDGELYAGVTGVTPRSVAVTASGSVVRVELGAAVYLDRASPGQIFGTARWNSQTMAARLVSAPSLDQDGPATVALNVTPPNVPLAGDVVVLRFGAEDFVLAIDDVTTSTDGSPPSTSPEIVLHGSLRQCRVEIPPVDSSWTLERLRVDLWTRSSAEPVLKIVDLGLAPGDVRHVERLPDDATAYDPSFVGGELWRDVLTPRAPIAGRAGPNGEDERLCVPFALGTLASRFLPARHADESALVRDGLSVFDASLFGDEELASRFATTLVADAEYVRFLAPVPRPQLIGVHAALPIDEATLIAVPDAIQPGWTQQGMGVAPPPDLAAAAPPAGSCIADDFVDCGPKLGPAPTNLTATADPSDGSIALEWLASADSAPFVLEEATSADWRGAIVAYEGPNTSVTLGRHTPGDYYYRVRGDGAPPTDWSAGASVRLVPGGGWVARSATAYDSDVLLATHRMLLRIAAARRDLMTVLSLPEHYREADAVAHAQLLGSPVASEIPLGAGFVPPLSTGENDALGFAALYHGWIYVREEDGLRALTLDGAVTGLMARRATTRGAWVAPANDTLSGVVALEQPADPSLWLTLLENQVNLVRATPRGFTVLSADTLATDDDVRPINVRRLLILLRRLALRLGVTYVFEPNDDAFRRMVQRGFEAILGDLFERGAFAGDTAASSFQVVTGGALNTPFSVDDGRFIVELRVAPSRPLSFLTLRLVQIGERVAVIGG